MNLLEGHCADGTFTTDKTEISGLGAADGPVTLGFRAEDAEVRREGGQITAPIYTLELLGDATMVSVRIGGALVSAKADKTFRAEIGDTVSIHIPQEHCHLFDAETGKRFD
jgi:multiple sugar transport system ATP-binding protein